jgi:hypothetical protein
MRLGVMSTVIAKLQTEHVRIARLVCLLNHQSVPWHGPEHAACCAVGGGVVLSVTLS